MPSVNIENLQDVLYDQLIRSVEKAKRDINLDALFCL